MHPLQTARVKSIRQISIPTTSVAFSKKKLPRYNNNNDSDLVVSLRRDSTTSCFCATTSKPALDQTQYMPFCQYTSDPTETSFRVFTEVIYKLLGSCNQITFSCSCFVTESHFQRFSWKWNLHNIHESCYWILRSCCCCMHGEAEEACAKTAAALLNSKTNTCHVVHLAPRAAINYYYLQIQGGIRKISFYWLFIGIIYHLDMSAM